MTPDQYCQQKLRQSRSSFSLGFLFMDEQRRQAMTALYAFCREVDDIVDLAQDKGIAQTKLDWWKNEIHACFNGRATHPVGLALQQALTHYPLQQGYFQDMIRGMEMDLAHQPFKNDAQLYEYCYCVAGTVGLLSIDIMGYSGQHTACMQKYARHLARSLQLINIIRDVKEDALRQRVYLPEERLQQYHLSGPQIINAAVNDTPIPALLDLLAELGQEAGHFYHSAIDHLPLSNRYAQRSGLIMAEIYVQLLKKMQQQNYPVLNQRIRIHPLHKLWIAWRTARREAHYQSHAAAD